MKSSGPVLLCKKKGGAWGHFRSGLECIYEILCFSLKSVRRWSGVLQYFSLCSSLDQLSAYGEVDKPSPNPDKESGTVGTSSENTAVAPNLSQDGQSGLTSSAPTDPAGFAASQRDPPPQASPPVPEGSEDLSCVPPVPPPPEEPYNSYLLCTGCAKMDSVKMRPQSASAAPPQDSVTLPPFCQPLPWPFPTYKGSVNAPVGPRVDVPSTRLRMPLPRCFYSPAPPAWSWPGQGSSVPDLNLHLYSSVAPSPSPPPPSKGFLGSVGMSSTVPHLCLPLVAPGKMSSVGEPEAVAGAALQCPVLAMQPYPLKPAEQFANTGSNLFRPLPQFGGQATHSASSADDVSTR